MHFIRDDQTGYDPKIFNYEEHIKIVDKKLEAFIQKQELQNKKVEDTVIRLMHTIEKIKTRLQDASLSHKAGSEPRNNDLTLVLDAGNNLSEIYS